MWCRELLGLQIQESKAEYSSVKDLLRQCQPTNKSGRSALKQEKEVNIHTRT